MIRPLRSNRFQVFDSAIFWVCWCVMGMTWLGASLRPVHAAPPALEQIERDLEAEDVETRRRAIEQLQEQPEVAAKLLPALVKRFRDEVPELRVAAARAVAKTGEEGRKWFPHFRRLFHDSTQTKQEEPVWYQVALVVGEEMGKAILPELIPLIDAEKAQDCRAASVAIYAMGADGKPAIPAIVKALSAESPDVTPELLYALRGMGAAAAESIPAVVRAMDFNNLHAQYWAAQTLAAMGPAAEPAVPDLIRKMTTGVASVRRHAALALGKIGPKIGDAGVEALIGGLDDFAFVVRENSLQALGELGPAAKKAAPILKQKLIERDIEPVGQALRTYWQITGDLEFVKPRFLARFGNENHAIEAIPQLGMMGKAAEFAVPRLVEATRSHDGVIRLLAAESLGKIGVASDEVLEALRRLAATDPDLDVRDAAAAALEELEKADGKEATEEHSPS